jgi:3-hydroxybutyryl-CoA dehydrogenase
MINEAYFTWESKVSTKDQIDIAMKLGTNYPLGPFEWARHIGLGRITGLLRSLSRTNPGYTPCEALVHEAGELKYD